MSPVLPDAIGRYLAAENAGSADDLLAAMAPDAVVIDEARQHDGHAAIRAWFEDNRRRYAPHVDVLAARQEPEAVVVTGRVSGTFPGSPVELAFRFELSGRLIARLEITA